MVHGLPVYLLHPSAESQTDILSGKDLRGILAIVGLLIMKIIRKKYRGRELLRDDFDFALVAVVGKLNVQYVLAKNQEKSRKRKCLPEKRSMECLLFSCECKST
ncbi:uncharacterized protein LOC116920402 [Daphnia magna]|uniref:uncharacterized protein LOC116920402 n=1 Tax=Daphnia magna TaxID=35525 RepID=UPI001E1BD5B0|nr:uncharacterized protein LOC116920402 [Daphnia magna]